MKYVCETLPDERVSSPLIVIAAESARHCTTDADVRDRAVRTTSRIKPLLPMAHLGADVKSAEEVDHLRPPDRDETCLRSATSERNICRQLGPHKGRRACTGPISGSG